MSKKILIADDERTTLEILKSTLTQTNYLVDTANSALEALKKLESNSYNLLITDVKMPRMSGLELLEKVKQEYPQMDVIVMTAYGVIDDAVAAMKKGAIDYILKPFSTEGILLVIQRALEQQDLVLENRYLKEEIKTQYSYETIVGSSKKMQEIYELMERVADTDSTVLIRGETGTGKELVARRLHYISDRKDKIFVEVDCVALTETLLESELFGHEKGAFTGAIKRKIGKFELAHNGTIFLDEIEDISPTMQVKLLRVLQERKFERVGGNEPVRVNVRVVAATNKDLEKAVAEGKFREDLYYRLNVIPIYLPPLRERVEDIPLLANHFLNVWNRKVKKSIKRISPKAMNALLNYPWPGNIRELENVIQRAVIMEKGEVITRVDLPVGKKSPDSEGSFTSMEMTGDLSFPAAKEQFEKEYLIALLKKSRGSIRAAAEYSLLDSKSIYLKMRRYGLKKEDFR